MVQTLPGKGEVVSSMPSTKKNRKKEQRKKKIDVDTNGVRWILESNDVIFGNILVTIKCPVGRGIAFESPVTHNGESGLSPRSVCISNSLKSLGCTSTCQLR